MIRRAACATAARAASAHARKALWGALETAGSAEAKRRGTSDPAAWKRATKRTVFTPLPLVDIQCTNRPTAIHQVMQLTP